MVRHPMELVEVSSQAGLIVAIRGPMAEVNVATGSVRVVYVCDSTSTPPIRKESEVEVPEPGTYAAACSESGEIRLVPEAIKP